MARTVLRTRTRRQSMPTISPQLVAGMVLLGEFAAFALTAGAGSMVLRAFLVALPLIYFIARSPVVGIYAITFLIPLELFARIPNEFFSLYKLLGALTLSSTIVHMVAGRKSAIPAQRTNLHRWLFGFMFLLACSLIWSIEPELTIQAARRLASLAIFYILVIRLVDTREKLRVLLGVLVVSAAIAGVFAIMAYVRGAAVFDTQGEVKVDGALRASGLSLDANFFAATILTALPICFLMLRQEKNAGIRFSLVLAAIAIILGTMYSYSRGGALTLGLIALLSFGAILRELKGRALAGALGSALAACILLAAIAPGSYMKRVQTLGSPMEGDESIRGRWLYVEFSRESIMETPLGVGAGNFPVAFRNSRFNQAYHYYSADEEGQKGRSAHNMYLEVAVESGLLGGVLFVGLIAFAGVESIRVGRHLRRKGEPFLVAANDAIGIGLLSFAFAGIFLSAQYEKPLWLFLALVPVMKNFAYEGEIFVPDLRKLRRALARREPRA